MSIAAIHLLVSGTFLAIFTYVVATIFISMAYLITRSCSIEVQENAMMFAFLIGALVGVGIGIDIVYNTTLYLGLYKDDVFHM